MSANGRPTLNAEELQLHLQYLKAEMTANAAFSRSQFFKQLLDPRRDIDDECGYPKMSSGIDINTYQDFYEREAIAARVVQVLPRESWQVQPLVYEEEDAETTTPFEDAWDELGASLRGENSHYRQEEGSPIWNTLRRADELSGIGSFGIILFGLDDGLDLSLPVKGVEEKNTNPVEKTKEGSSYVSGEPSANYSFTVNLGEPDATGKKPGARKLLYLRVFPESLVQITQYESNPTSPRFGQPVMYRVTLSDPREQTAAQWSSIPLATRSVHWTRVLHVADNLGSSEIFGVPRMRPVFNRLYDLRKIYGASGEGYYKGAFMGLSFESHPQLGGDVDVNPTEFKEQLEQYQNGLQRYLFSTGMTAKSLPPQTVDPTPYINIHIEAICIQLGIPVRVFKGSERGELASSQDDASWNDRLRERQRNYLTPRLIVPFIDRLILYGVLPEPAMKKPEGKPETVQEPEAVEEVAANAFPPAAAPKPAPRKPVLPPEKKEKPEEENSPGGYVVEWPDLTSQTESERADVALKGTQADAAYVAGGVSALIPELDYLTRVRGFTEEEAKSMLENAVAAEEERFADEQLMAEEQGFKPAPPAGFVDPEAEKAKLDVEKAKASSLKAKGGFPPKKPAVNVFCPTGPDGGIDPTCKPGLTGQAPKREILAANKLAKEKVQNAPVPSREEVEKARRDLASSARPGGEARGGSAASRRKQRENLFKEFGGAERGYVACPWTGIKMHWTDDPKLNPHGYPKFERGKIFTKRQGGGYQLHNLIPESYASNRARNNKPIRTENLK